MQAEDVLKQEVVVPLTEGSLGIPRKCAALEKRPMIFNMTVLPSEGERLMTKSKLMWDQG